MDISVWRFDIAVGRADEKMSRGSFRHHDRIRQKRHLLLSELKSTDSGTTFLLTDSKSGKSAHGGWERVDENTAQGCVLHRLRLDLAPFGTNRLWVSLPTHDDEHFFGGGESFAAFDLQGKRVRVWVAEHQNARIIAEKLLREKLFGIRPERTMPFDKYESYYATPIFVSSCGYFLYAEGAEYMELDFRGPGCAVLFMRGNADIYCGEAESFPALSETLSALLGKQPPLPEYLLNGVILASQTGIKSVERKLALAEQYDIPLVGVWCQDWCGCRKTDFGYQVMWNWQWDRSLYPSLPDKIRQWKTQGIAFFGYINPFLATEGSLYAEASARGYCVKDRAGQDYMVTITTFPAAMLDLTNPEARRWYKDIIRRELIDIGMAGWMADFGEYLPTDAVLYSGEDPVRKHNEWPTLWAHLNREVIAESGRDGQVLFFVRAGHTGTVAAAPMVWNGDQHADWSKDQGIGSVIPAALSLAMSGVGLCHSDVGGYTSIMHMKRSRELLMRWAELCCFSPLMRMHEGNRPDANIQFDHDVELLRHIAAMGRLHRLLKPYLCAQLAVYYERGVPLMRPLFYHYPCVDLTGIADEYLLGRDILVAPVLQSAQESRVCVLPEDEWLHIFTGQLYGGGSHTVASPLGCPPVFIRSRSPFAGELLRAINHEIKERRTT